MFHDVFFSSLRWGGALSESIGRHKSLEAFLSPGAWIGRVLPPLPVTVTSGGSLVKPSLFTLKTSKTIYIYVYIICIIFVY